MQVFSKLSSSKARNFGFSLFAFWLLVNLSACDNHRRQIEINGFTMGTSYQVKLKQVVAEVDQAELEQAIAQRLAQLNATFSHYDKNSELSRLNRHPSGEVFLASSALYRVLELAQQVHQQSLGGFDISISPLVELWGFGTKKTLVREPPQAKELELLLADMGQIHLQLKGIQDDEQGQHVGLGRVVKTRNLDLDLSAIAKGYAVDQIADWLSEQGFDNYLVEIGGELRLAHNKGTAWKIGIEQPNSELNRIASKALSLKNTALATSGDYRNFFEYNGQRYSHTLDPRTGWPVTHSLASVTVLHPSCALADAYATAFTVLGAEQGLKLADELGIAAYFIEQGKDGFKVSKSQEFKRFE